MKITKKLPLIVILSLLLITTQISCASKEQPIKPSTEIQSELESSTNIYFKYPLRDYPIGKTDNDELYWDCSGNDFGNYLGTYNGFHPGEDWNLKGGINGSIDLGEPVYSIGSGKVVKISPIGRNGSLGYLVAIEHSGNFVIPSKELSSSSQNASYKDEVANKIYSVYIHLKDIEVKENDNVDENSVIGYIMDPGGGPHLHFEIRHPDSIPSSDWSMVYGSSGEYDKSNWQKFPDGGYNGYYKDLQKMIDAGFRDPSDFIEANYKPYKPAVVEEISEEPVVVEEVTDEPAEEEIASARKEERGIESEKGNLIPPGFVTIQDDNWAIALLALSGVETISSDMKSGYGGYEMSYADEIFATFAITKLSPVGEGPTGRPPLGFNVDLVLIDDRGEHYSYRSTSLTGRYQGESLKYYPLDELPEGFTYTISVPTRAPRLALGHIQKIMIDGQEVTPIKFNLGGLGDLEGVISFGEELKVSKWLTLKPLRATSLPSDEWHPEPRIQLEIEVRNSSYSEKGMYTLIVGAQRPDGTITNGDSRPGYSAVDILGNTSVILSRTISGETPPVQAYLLLAASETGTEYFWIMHPE